MKEHYIVEGDYGRWNGCMVKVPGVPRKLFSYSKFMTAQSCQEAAIAHRDACVKHVGGWAALFLRSGGRLGVYSRPLLRANKNSTTKILGVSRVKRRYHYKSPKKAPRFTWTYQAHLMLPDGRIRRAQYSVRRHGEDKARFLAVQARGRFERERDRMLRRIGVYFAEEQHGHHPHA